MMWHFSWKEKQNEVIFRLQKICNLKFKKFAKLHFNFVRKENVFTTFYYEINYLCVFFARKIEIGDNFKLIFFAHLLSFIDNIFVIIKLSSTWWCCRKVFCPHEVLGVTYYNAFNGMKNCHSIKLNQEYDINVTIWVKGMSDKENCFLY